MYDIKRTFRSQTHTHYKRYKHLDFKYNISKTHGKTNTEHAHI